MAKQIKTPIQDLSLSISADELTLNSTIDQDTTRYLTSLTNRTANDTAIVKLLTTKYKGIKRNMLIESGIQSALSRKWLMALSSTGGARWILAVLDGKEMVCPIPKGAGIHSSPVIAYFKANAEQRIEAVKAERAERKAAKEADKVTTTTADTVTDSIPLDASSLFAQYCLLNDAQQAEFLALVNGDIQAIKKVA